MADDFLGDRKKALEESFFAKENERLLENLRAEKAKLAAKEALAEASQIRDESVLDSLVELGIGPDTWTALSLIPLEEILVDTAARRKDDLRVSVEGPVLRWTL